MHTTKLLALGAIVTATTLATAFANADTPAAPEPKEISTLSSSGDTKEIEKHRDMRSHTGMIRSQSGMIKKEEFKKRAMEKKAQMMLRDTIIDKLLAGEALTDAEKLEAKKMLEERKARRDAVKSNIKEAREDKGEKLTIKERKDIRKDTREEMKKEIRKDK